MQNAEWDGAILTLWSGWGGGPGSLRQLLLKQERTAREVGPYKG